MLSSRSLAAMWQTEEALAAAGCGSAGAGKGSSRSEHPAEGRTGAEAAAATFVELVRRWPALMQALEPCEDARSAAADRAADLEQAAEGREAAALEQTYPLPRRITLAHVQATVAAGNCSLLAKREAGNKVQRSLVGVLAEMGALQGSCAGLVDAAHAAGLAWLSAAEVAPGLEACQAWCSDFMAICAGARRAHVQAEACREGASVLTSLMDEGMEEFMSQLQGGRHALDGCLLRRHWLKQCSVRQTVWWSVLLDKSAV